MLRALNGRIFGRFAESVTWKIALIALGPILGLGLTLLLNRYSDGIRNDGEEAYRLAQNELA